MIEQFLLVLFGLAMFAGFLFLVLFLFAFFIIRREWKNAAKMYSQYKKTRGV